MNSNMTITKETKTATKKHTGTIIIIITGTPGVGKHTVAKEIMKMTADWHIIDVNESARKAGLYEYNIDAHTNDVHYTTSKHNKNTIDIDTDKLSNIIKQEIKASKNYIVVGHLAPYVIQATKEVIFVAILRRDPYDLLKVYKDRGYTDLKSRENAGSEALGVIAYDTFAASYNRIGQFNTTKRDPKKVARGILDVIHDIRHNNKSSDYNSQHPISKKNIEPWKPIDWMRDDDDYNDDDIGRVSTKTRRMLEDFFKN